MRSQQQLAHHASGGLSAPAQDAWVALLQQLRRLLQAHGCAGAAAPRLTLRDDSHAVGTKFVAALSAATPHVMFPQPTAAPCVLLRRPALNPAGQQVVLQRDHRVDQRHPLQPRRPLHPQQGLHEPEAVGHGHGEQARGDAGGARGAAAEGEAAVRVVLRGARAGSAVGEVVLSPRQCAEEAAGVACRQFLALQAQQIACHPGCVPSAGPERVLPPPCPCCCSCATCTRTTAYSTSLTAV